MSNKLELLRDRMAEALGDALLSSVVALGELSVEIDSSRYHDAMCVLRDSDGLRFDQLIDLCGVDYSTHASRSVGGRYAVVSHLMSVELNHRLRVRVVCPDDGFPVIDSVADVWPGVNWFEREAFDLFGILFSGHGDLRRILTDYGFVGHPFRKDFPISGYAEMRYDPDQKRVVYQPVTIEPREVTPRIVREGNYGDV